ncbi:MAG: nucleotidyltransferase [Planctomycetes bacterium]|nr:nucleotidyltransferase [Planctomycetota bacterium]MBM4084449.1 nucleotidyltransferase [Planctomycetota bacterium]
MNKGLNKEEIIQRLGEALPSLRERYGVERIALYGSFVKGKPGRRSDADILVRLAKPLGLKFVELARHLEEMLGRKVDLATFEALRRSMENARYKEIATEVQRTLVYV